MVERLIVVKKRRHEEIIRTITANSIETQEELAEKLRQQGFMVTQATVSRDIRELNLTKVIGEGGKQRYALLDGGGTTPGTLNKAIREAIKSVDAAGNLMVIKTLTGMGMAVAVNIDGMENNDIIGTIAGDDVVFCAVKNLENIELIKKMLLQKG